MIRKYSYTIIRALIVILLLILQMIILILLPFWLQAHAIYVYFFIEIISVILMFTLLSNNSNSAYKILWLGVVMVLPISGHIMYALWGKEGSKNYQHKRLQDTIDFYKQKKEADIELQKRIHEKGMTVGKISDYLCNSGYPAYENTDLKYFEIGEKAFASMMEDMRNAKKFIFLSFFTIADGKIWDDMCEILVEKAKQGLEIKIMYDDAGSIFQLSDDTIYSLKSKNIKICKFNSIEKNVSRLYFQYRNHQKIVVIDGNIAYTGGVNISDRYANIDSPYGHWKDVAVRMEGDGVWGMTLIFFGMWDYKEDIEAVEKYRPDTINKSKSICQPYADGPANNPDNPAKDLYHLLTNLAEKELYIMTPYLILDDETKECLCLAAKSGVDVKIITPGIPDKKRVKLVTEWNYGELLKAGVHIYEYEPGFVHAKVCINDNSGIIGTVNMDFRSFYLHYECGMWFYDEDVRRAVHADFEETLKSCREITYEQWKSRPILIKIKQIFWQSFKSQF